MSETKHTPLPWEVVSISGYPAVWAGGRVICSLRGYSLAELKSDKAKADTKMIVRAVNSHAEMLEALEAALEVMGEAGSAEHLKQLTDEELGKLWIATTKKIESAIQKAKVAL